MLSMLVCFAGLTKFMSLHVADDFLRFSKGIHAVGSNAPTSYVTAIEKTQAALQRHHVFLAPGESIWDIHDEARLQALYALVKQEKIKGESGIFREEEKASYWKKNYCSAAINEFIRFVSIAKQCIVAREQAQSSNDFTARLEKIEKSICATGKESLRPAKVRVNQYLFRKMVLDNYRHRCCITGLNIPEVLRASHIKPWAEGEECRLDPQNGLCLSATFDAAFDRHLISLDEDLRLIFAPSLKEYYTHDSFNQVFRPYEGKRIELPVKYLPSPKFLQQHRAKLA